MTTPAQPRARCFYCDGLLDDDQARLERTGGRIYGPCCADIAHTGVDNSNGLR